MRRPAMELEAGSSSVDRRRTRGRRRASDAGCRSVGSACAGEGRCTALIATRSAHTTPETWTITLP